MKNLLLILSLLTLGFSLEVKHSNVLAETVDCNKEDKVGVCPTDLKNHKCQMVKDDGGSQKIVFGKCEDVNKDTDNDGKNEIVCECVEEKAKFIEYDVGKKTDVTSNQSSTIQQEPSEKKEDKEGNKKDNKGKRTNRDNN